MTKITSSEGFSLVELIIFMALAGLILYFVFLALTNASNDRKDNASLLDAKRYLTAARQWVDDNNGSLPGQLGSGCGPVPPQIPCFDDVTNGIQAKYITAGSTPFKAPDGNTWQVTWCTMSGVPPKCTIPPSGHGMEFAAQAGCQGSLQSPPIVMYDATGSRQMAIWVPLSGGRTRCIAK